MSFAENVINSASMLNGGHFKNVLTLFWFMYRFTVYFDCWKVVVHKGAEQNMRTDTLWASKFGGNEIITIRQTNCLWTI